MSQNTALIVPNDIVPLINTIINKYNDFVDSILNTQNGNVAPSSQNIQIPELPLPPLPAPPTAPAIRSLMPTPPPAPATRSLMPTPAAPATRSLMPTPPQINTFQQKPKIDVYYHNICSRGVHCYDIDCKYVHFPKYNCHHGDNCRMNNIYRNCGFLHTQYKNVMDMNDNKTYNLLEGWNNVIPDWIKTPKSRAIHFNHKTYSSKEEYSVKHVHMKASNDYKTDMNDNIKNISNHSVCTDWIISKCKNALCDKKHYIPLNYKSIECLDWKDNKCMYGSKNCKDIHGSNDMILYYIDDRTKSHRSRSRSRDRNESKHR